MRSVIVNTFAVMLFLLSTSGVKAGSTISAMNITTRVLPVVKYEIVHQEENILITEDNIERGYVDVHGAVIISVMTNSTNGYVLTFFVGRDLFHEVEVLCDSVSSEIDDTNNEIYMRYEGMKYTVKEFSFRFYLSDVVMPGMYDWPVAFTIHAI